MKVGIIQLLILLHGSMPVLGSHAESFWNHLAHDWVPVLHKTVFNQIAPLVPKDKIVALENSIKNDLIDPILVVYRRRLKSFDDDHLTITAFDASLAWINSAKKQWNHWSKNIFPLVMKDPKILKRSLKDYLDLDDKEDEEVADNNRDDSLEDIDILDHDISCPWINELGESMSGSEWSGSQENTPIAKKVALMKCFLEASTFDMKMKRIQKKIKHSFDMIEGAGKGSDESIPSLELSVDSESSDSYEVDQKPSGGTLKNKISAYEIYKAKSDYAHSESSKNVKSSKLLKDQKLQNVLRDGTVEDLETLFGGGGGGGGKDVGIQRNKNCFRSCMVSRIFFYLLVGFKLIPNSMHIPVVLVIMAWHGIMGNMSPKDRIKNENKDDSKEIIEEFIHDIDMLKEDPDLMKDSNQIVYWYRQKIENELKHSSTQGQKISSQYSKQLKYLTKDRGQTSKSYWKTMENKLKSLLRGFSQLANQSKRIIELELQDLINNGRLAGQYYQDKLQNELNYLIDLSKQIAISYQVKTGNELKYILRESTQLALSYPERGIGELYTSIDYLWRVFSYNVDSSLISLRNTARKGGYALGESAGKGAVNHIARAGRKRFKSLKNTEVMIHNIAFESAERVGAGVYFGFQRQLLSGIVRVLFLVIPTSLIGLYIYQFKDEYFGVNK